MFTNDEITIITCAENFGGAVQIDGVSTDSRKIAKGDLFVALRGENFDGHKFADEVAEKGASAIVTDHKLEVSIPQYVVEDTLTAYQQLARHHRLKINVPVVGVTGTNGKTTVKDIINSILSYVDNPLCSEANFNNHIGVPATLLKLKKEHTHAVVEMGMNHPGEIKTLSEIALPDAAVITSIGCGHLEFLGSVEVVMEAKLEICEGLNKSGTIILPLNSEFYEKMKEAALNYGINNILSFGDSEEADFSFILDSTDETGSKGTLKTPSGNIKTKINLAGKHNCINIAAAVAAVMTLKKDISLDDISASFITLKPVNMRCQLFNINGTKIILDCYNANPDSMRAAINLLCDLKPAGRKIAFLGDMLELGLRSEKFHAEVGAYAAEKNIDLIVASGENSNAIITGAVSNGLLSERCYEFKTVEMAAEFIAANIRHGDALLVKASRRAHFEDVMKTINSAGRMVA